MLFFLRVFSRFYLSLSLHLKTTPHENHMKFQSIGANKMSRFQVQFAVQYGPSVRTSLRLSQVLSRGRDPSSIHSMLTSAVRRLNTLKSGPRALSQYLSPFHSSSVRNAELIGEFPEHPPILNSDRSVSCWSTDRGGGSALYVKGQGVTTSISPLSLLFSST